MTEASAVAERLYDVRAMAFDLPSERDQNVLLESESGERFILKLANLAERREVLEAECAVMLHLEP
ncbi:MAG: serine kinase, partial [Gemmatimonadales bacterium]